MENPKSDKKFQMLFILELQILENIVKDGVKQMLSHAYGRSHDAKKRPSVKAMKLRMFDQLWGKDVSRTN